MNTNTTGFRWFPKMFASLCALWKGIFKLRPKKKKLFVSCNGLKKNKVGRSVKKISLDNFFGQKCGFYACFTLIGSWEGNKNSMVGIFLNKNLLG